MAHKRTFALSSSTLVSMIRIVVDTPTPSMVSVVLFNKLMSVSYVSPCPLIDDDLPHNIVKIAVLDDPQPF